MSCLLSREKGGILQSKACPSSLSILNVPLKYVGLDISHYLDLLPTYHMCPLGAWRDTCELYWKAGWSRDNTGSCKNKLDICMYYAPLVLACPTTPRPRTVSRVPDREKIRQLRSLSCTVASPRFSSLMQYRHQYTLFC